VGLAPRWNNPVVKCEGVSVGTWARGHGLYFPRRRQVLAHIIQGWKCAVIVQPGVR